MEQGEGDAVLRRWSRSPLDALGVMRARSLGKRAQIDGRAQGQGFGKDNVEDVGKRVRD